MKIKTNIHVGLTTDMILSAAEGAAMSAGQWLGAGAQTLGNNFVSWVSTPQAQGALDRAFWFPMQPPF